MTREKPSIRSACATGSGWLRRRAQCKALNGCSNTDVAFQHSAFFFIRRYVFVASRCFSSQPGAQCRTEYTRMSLNEKERQRQQKDNSSVGGTALRRAARARKRYGDYADGSVSRGALPRLVPGGAATPDSFVQATHSKNEPEGALTPGKHGKQTC